MDTGAGGWIRERPGEFPGKLIAGLLLFAKEQFEYESPTDDGTSISAHVRQAAKTLGVPLEEIPGVPQLACPPELVYLWVEFLEINGARGSSGFAPATINFTELAGWMLVTGIRLMPWEVRVVRSLDTVWFEVFNARSRRTAHKD